MSTATPEGAREHARAQADRSAATMQTIPASQATDLPHGLTADRVVWDETIGAGGYASRVLAPGVVLRLEDLDGDACAGLLLYNADHPVERLNVADTVKVQWNAYLGAPQVLLSDMGRVLASMVTDTVGRHDFLCGTSNAAHDALRYGDSGNHSAHPSGRDRFLVALAKHGLGRADLMANANLFRSVRVDDDGSLRFDHTPNAPGGVVELRMEMAVLVVVVNTPHVLDPRSTYPEGRLRLLAYHGDPYDPSTDPCRSSSPEARRAFENTEDYRHV